jgi:subtilisin family serine protease
MPAPRHFFLFESTKELEDEYRDGENAVDALIKREIQASSAYRVVSIPSKWKLESKSFTSPPPRFLVVAIEFDNAAALNAFIETALHSTSTKLRPLIIGNRLVEGVDLAIEASDHWCLGDAERGLFGTRRTARDLMRVTGGIAALDGANVNVVMVDRGIDSSYPPGYNYIDGWAGPNGEVPGATPGGHGTMVLRNVLDLARNANIWDLPLLPPRITYLGAFLSDAVAAYITMLFDIIVTLAVAYPGPWVLVNAWSVYSRDREAPPASPDRYTDNPAHPFNFIIAIANWLRIDVVFSAGNCGLFCPDPRCGIRDRGPGRSILGANSHPDVLTVAAVRTDELWLGYSSEGPGLLSLNKPDVCAPSEFSENTDAFERNGGTSAPCGLIAGMIAALRSDAAWQAISPQRMRDNIRTQASHYPIHEPRTGYGIVDAAATYGAGP